MSQLDECNPVKTAADVHQKLTTEMSPVPVRRLDEWVFVMWVLTEKWAFCKFRIQTFKKNVEYEWLLWVFVMQQIVNDNLWLWHLQAKKYSLNIWLQ